MAPLVAVAPRSGEVQFETDAVWIYEPLHACLDLEDICARGQVGSASEVALRFDLDDGTLEQDSDSIPSGARELGDGGLYGTIDRPGERIGRVVDGKTLWEVPAAELFGRGYGSDGGWGFVWDQEAEVYVGTVGLPFTPTERRTYLAGEPVRFRAEDTSEMLVFDANTGQRLWRDEGTDTMCLMAVSGKEDSFGPPVRCRMSGFVTTTLGSNEKTYDHLKVAVEGYQPETGETTWSVPVHPETGMGCSTSIHVSTSTDASSSGRGTSTRAFP